MEDTPLTPPHRLLVVEDDAELGALVCDRLRREGFEVELAANGVAARDRIIADPPDLVVLDVMLPGLDGFGVCRAVRPAYRGPILMLTARDDDIDEVLGLEMGADDYMTKPVRPRVLIARVRALLRRAQQSPSEAPAPGNDRRVSVGQVVVDAGRREVRVADALVEVTTAEFDLLWFLASRAGEVVDRDTLYREVYGTAYDGLDRAADVYVSRLRQKLGDDPRSPRYLKTVRGVGYLFAAPAS